MKLINLFRKNQKTVYSKFQKLEKKQLEKVVGGGDGDSSTDPDAVTPIRGKNVRLGKPGTVDL